MAAERILIVDDTPAVQSALTVILKHAGYDPLAVGDGAEALRAVKSTTYHLHLIDLCLPGGMDGLELLQAIRKINSQAVCIVLSGYGTVELAVKAMKQGAFDFISKPFEQDAVLALVKTALEFSRLKQENLILQKTVREKFRPDNIIGDSQAMRHLYHMIDKVADNDSTVLIQGESGTGKEMVAKTIHYNSPRRDRPLIPINCAAIPEALLESELFGHEKGAFTGASSSRIGRFEAAHGGTIFLDEIGEMPLALQVKLLRVIQEREFERVGGNRSIQVDVRIIAATNQDLEQAVEEKRFRKDLFYRLNVIPILTPALRDRREDIPLLANYFLNKFNEKTQQSVEGIAEEAMRCLLAYPWPGNVRELENLMERLVILKKNGPITPADLPEKFLSKQEGSLSLPLFDFPDQGIDLTEIVHRFEEHLIQQAMIKANGIKNQAAQLLHLNRTTLVEKLKRGKNLPPSMEPAQSIPSNP